LETTNGVEIQDIERETGIRKNRLTFFLELMVSSKIISKSGKSYKTLRKDGALNFLAPRNEAEYEDFFSLFNDVNMPIFTPTGRVAGRSTILCNLFAAVSSETGNPQPTLLNRHLQNVHSSLVLNKKFEDNINRLPWLKTLLRDYCEDIGWTNEFEWPEYLK